MGIGKGFLGYGGARTGFPPGFSVYMHETEFFALGEREKGEGQSPILQYLL
jgi:hypothetical protein